YDVPQQTIATRSPGTGRTSRSPAAASAARVQNSGWLFSLSSTCVTAVHPHRSDDCSCKIERSFEQNQASGGGSSTAARGLGSPSDHATTGTDGRADGAGRPLADAAGAARGAGPAGRRGGGRRAGGVGRDDPAGPGPAGRAADAG